MTIENIERIQTKLDSLTKKWRFVFIFIFIQFIPPFVSGEYDVSKTGELFGYILENAVIYSLE